MEKKPLQCPICNAQNTVKHVMVECTKYFAKHNLVCIHLNNASLTLKYVLEETDKF